jgi:pimeloyl-ACP methyl ester carboxylesterase
MADARAQPFTVEIDPAEVARVIDRVRAYAWPPPPADERDEWKYGMNSRWLGSLCRHWTDGYDWGAAEHVLNRFPQYLTKIDGVSLHFVEVVGEAEGRRPLLMLHGWPSCHFEFWNVAEQLAFPSRFGGAAEDAFDVVIASLPGYGFSGPVEGPIGPRRIAALLDSLMTEGLGYTDYMLQGGDQGAIVGSFSGSEFPDTCAALHVNLIGWRPTIDDDGAVGDEERGYMQRMLHAELPDMAYAIQHFTRPQTLAIALEDSPVGTAAWMLDKFHDWSDLRGTDIETIHDRDDLLTTVMIYLLTGTVRTSLWSYPALVAERAELSERPWCGTPTAVARFPVEVVGFTPPRRWVERYYEVRRWTEFERGGHFVARERPAELIDDVRAFAAECFRPRG